ncbi:MAG: hypothetical protein A3D74_03365 [Candidatus Levybacteria bacterium RIFCSPHIGHO2_02_FULL_37_13]|nr:MAG: hypothetical protein A3D74_03365 [Candidatus Levybacteria bacterium RIFCSPHIGHO2_02_FULL_37_13]OGH29805.1 MAG: hypothetical protein A3E40_02330 [Candidatus Levybacteria bacterium RIFCSPHIGHO2_12_FULL_37_9]OGH39994.1 MAG: hypothetical protein A3B41_03380 [Candidatus Levybacteria bacterium RIFCSPLOWO2_01_FULL_37_26]
MLTKSDLQQIERIVRTIVREEVENETQAIKNELQADITMSRVRVQNDIGELKDRIKNIDIRLTKLENKVTKMHKDLKNEIKMVVHYLDKENIKTLKRVEKIEAHLGLAVS